MKEKRDVYKKTLEWNASKRRITKKREYLECKRRVE